MWNNSTNSAHIVFPSIRTWKNYLCTNCRVFWLVSFNCRDRVLLINWRWSVSNDATHINICKSVTFHTYIMYWSGHFSKKAANTFLRFIAVIPFAIALGPKTHNKIYLTCELQFYYRPSVSDHTIQWGKHHIFRPPIWTIVTCVKVSCCLTYTENLKSQHLGCRSESYF